MIDPLYRPYWPYIRRVEIRRGLKLVVGAAMLVPVIIALICLAVFLILRML